MGWQHSALVRDKPQVFYSMRHYFARKLAEESLLMENEEENVDVEVQKSTGSIENEENEKAKIEIPQKRKRQGKNVLQQA
ncbi:hypothetical protein F8388_019388 [Cannabis sativa]|uniref:Uncharacterized protein n=1 Tax=Cannabis sativa TaxID=3483 RepID=A0A7J6FI10_CANSA|nr:hypothetical protein F8388_019388 [Cannabis sativa]